VALRGDRDRRERHRRADPDRPTDRIHRGPAVSCSRSWTPRPVPCCSPAAWRTRRRSSPTRPGVNEPSAPRRPSSWSVPRPRLRGGRSDVGQTAHSDGCGGSGAGARAWPRAGRATRWSLVPRRQSRHRRPPRPRRHPRAPVPPLRAAMHRVRTERGRTGRGDRGRHQPILRSTCTGSALSRATTSSSPRSASPTRSAMLRGRRQGRDRRPDRQGVRLPRPGWAEAFNALTKGLVTSTAPPAGLAAALSQQHSCPGTAGADDRELVVRPSRVPVGAGVLEHAGPAVRQHGPGRPTSADESAAFGGDQPLGPTCTRPVESSRSSSTWIRPTRPCAAQRRVPEGQLDHRVRPSR